MGDFFQALILGLGMASFVYLLIGAFLCMYEKSQTDELNWKILFKWPKAIMGKDI